MIETIRGEIAALNPAAVTIDTASGVGYLLNITLPTFSALDGRKEARLVVHEAVRDGAVTLYGFTDYEEREVFRALLGVAGVGASSARMILSAISSAELCAVIAHGDVKRLKAVKGVGAKTAERIIVELKDKVGSSDMQLPGEAEPASAVYDEALEALLILGFERRATQKALKKVLADNPSATLETAIKKAMAQM